MPEEISGLFLRFHPQAGETREKWRFLIDRVVVPLRPVPVSVTYTAVPRLPEAGVTHVPPTVADAQIEVSTGPLTVNGRVLLLPPDAAT